MNDANSKFKGKYRITSSRLKGWDYSLPGHYFVTICTKYHIHAIIVLHEASVETPRWGVS
jgi:hypothetical protein